MEIKIHVEQEISVLQKKVLDFDFFVDYDFSLTLSYFSVQNRKTKRHKWASVKNYDSFQRNISNIPKPEIPDNILYQVKQEITGAVNKLQVRKE